MKKQSARKAENKEFRRSQDPCFPVCFNVFLTVFTLSPAKTDNFYVRGGIIAFFGVFGMKVRAYFADDYYNHIERSMESN